MPVAISRYKTVPKLPPRGRALRSVKRGQSGITDVDKKHRPILISEGRFRPLSDFLSF